MVRYIDDHAIPLYRDTRNGRTFLLEIMVNRSEEMQTVKYANDYSLSLFGYTQENFVKTTCTLFVPQEQDQVRQDCTRMKRSVPSGDCIFDVYQIEISDQQNTYQMNVLLDRTEEVTVRLKLQQDYLRLVQILQEISCHEWEDADMASHEKLKDIKKRVEAMAEKYIL